MMRNTVEYRPQSEEILKALADAKNGALRCRKKNSIVS